MTLSPVYSRCTPPGQTPRSAGAEEALDLGHDRVEVTGLPAACGGEPVAVHRVTDPDDGMPALLHGGKERRQELFHLLGAEARDQGHPARDPRRVELLAELDGLVGGRLRAELDTDRVVDAREELDVRAVERARAFADPEHVRRAVVPVARERVAAREALLVVEQEAFVARPDVDLVELRRRGEVDPAGGHELERALDLGGERLVLLALRRARDEVLVPGVHLGEIGEAALGEGAARG